MVHLYKLDLLWCLEDVNFLVKVIHKYVKKSFSSINMICYVPLHVSISSAIRNSSNSLPYRRLITLENIQNIFFDLTDL